jgi:quercetin dioxygenase-like cupin family protein
MNSDKRPELTNSVFDMDSYDIVFLGYPNWWGTMPMAVYTFLESYDFSGKTIIPFCTHGGSGLGHSVEDIRKLCPKAEVENPIAFYGSSVSNANAKVEEWIKDVMNEVKHLNDLSRSVIFPKGNKADSRIFIGNVWVKMLVTDKEYNCQIYNVTFEPCARTYWHSHPGGQILLVTGGKGYYQQEGKPERLLHPGDIVKIPPKVKHWHGATKNSWFVHLGITTNPQAGGAEWFEELNEEEYDALEEQK